MAYKKAPTPITLDTFDESSIGFKNLYINHEYNLRSVPITYKSPELGNKLVVMIKGCRIIMAKGPSEKSSANSLYVNITDKSAIELFKKIEEVVLKAAFERRVEWFGNEDFDEDEISEIHKPSIIENAKFMSHNMNINLSRFVKIVNMGVPTNEDPMSVLAPNQIVDICIEVEKAKPATKTLKLGYTATKIKITGVSEEAARSVSYFPVDFDDAEFKIGQLETHAMGGKFAKLTYAGSSPTFVLNDINARIFHNEQEVEDSKTKEKKKKDVYSLSVRLTKDEDIKLFQRVDKALFDGFKKGHMGYLDRSKPMKDSILEKLYSTILYNKEDREKIRAKQDPKNPPALRISIYWNADYGFGKNFVDPEGKLINVAEIVNKPITIQRLEFYCKHMWFGVEATTVKFSVSKCVVEESMPDYDMDGVGDIAAAAPSPEKPISAAKANGIVSDSDGDDV
jgi:hypothetical protein